MNHLTTRLGYAASLFMVIRGFFPIVIGEITKEQFINGPFIEEITHGLVYIALIKMLAEILIAIKK